MRPIVSSVQSESIQKKIDRNSTPAPTEKIIEIKKKSVFAGL